MSAHDLDAHRQPFGGETAGQRNGRKTDGCNLVAGLYPIDVGSHFFAVNFFYTALLCIKRRYLAYRKNQKLIGLHEFLNTVIKFGSSAFDCSQLRVAQFNDFFISNALPYTRTARSSVQEVRRSAALGNCGGRVPYKTGGKYSAACGLSVCRHTQSPCAHC